MTAAPTATGGTVRRRPAWGHDVVPGLIALGLGAFSVLSALTMPELRPGVLGPGLFPLLIGGALVLLGAALTVKGLLSRAGRDADEEDEDGMTALPSLQRWGNILGVLGAVAFYAIAAETLGFLITMTLTLVAIMLLLRAKWWVALITSAVITGLLYAVFQYLLLVQLPTGLVG